YRRYKNANATSDDFRRVMEEVSGSDLAWFFDQWLRRAGSPTLEGTWRHDAAARSLVVELNQSQVGDPFRLPIDLAILVEGRAEPEVTRLELTEKAQTFRLPWPASPATCASTRSSGCSRT